MCGITVEEVLQAAHIKAVKDGGNDDVENGIVLCANHHLMYDSGLFKFDQGKIQILNAKIKNHIADGLDVSQYTKS